MRKTAGKMLSLLVCAAIILSISACGSSSAAGTELSSDVVQADVHEYITTIIDPSATITSFSQTQNSVSNTETEVQCSAAYSGSNGAATGTFVLTYMLENNTWILEDLSADLGSGTAATVSAETQGNVVAGGDDVAEQVADIFAGIQTDIDTDLSGLDDSSNQNTQDTTVSGIQADIETDLAGLENWGDHYTQEYPESVNGVSTLAGIAEIYTFTLEGKTYALPCNLQEFLNDGWDTGLIDAATDTLDARTYSVLLLYKGNKQISTLVANFDETAIPVEQGVIIEITISAGNDVSFQTGKGLAIGDSSARVTELYGSENYATSDSGVEYRYLRQLGLQENIVGIMREYTVEDCFSIQWDSSGTVDYIQMKFLNKQ